MPGRPAVRDCTDLHRLQLVHLDDIGSLDRIDAAGPAASTGAESVRSSKLLADWPTPRGVLVISGQMDGYLEPCGCTQGQLGGLIRRFDFVQRLKAQNWPVALIDLGSLIKDPAAARGGFEQAKIKFGIALKAFSTLKYDAIALSPEDLKVGIGEAFAQFLNGLGDSTKIVVANVHPGAGFESKIQESQIISAGPVKLGVTAVVDPEAIAKLNDPDKAELLAVVQRPDDVLGKALAGMEGKSEYQVLMVQGPPELAKRLATAYPGFDVVVATSQFADPLDREPLMLNGGKTMLVTVGRRGKYVGVVGFFADAGQKMRYYPVTLDHRYNGPGTEMKKVIEDEYRNMLKVAGVVDSFPRHDYTGGTAGCHLRRRRDLPPVPPEHVREMVQHQARPGLRRPGARSQAQYDLRRGMHQLPHDGLRVQLGLAVRGRDAASEGQPVRELPWAGVEARLEPPITSSIAIRSS